MLDPPIQLSMPPEDIALAETEAKALRERAERAEARVARAEEEARRSFWQRWLG